MRIKTRRQFSSLIKSTGHVASLAALALLITLSLASPVSAQTFTVLHNFTNGTDGGVPTAGLSMDRAGNLYGTASEGGNAGTNCHVEFLQHGCGTAFKLAHSATGWTFGTLYQFNGLNDGAPPSSRVIFGPDGALYGTATYGGLLSCDPGWFGCGVVYRLNPQPTFCRSVSCPWVETPIYTFQQTTDGNNPEGDLIFDAQGNIYGTTNQGGHIDYGVVFELMPSSGSWTESVLYAFPGLTLDRPESGVIFDRTGNLYGTANCNNCISGGVFELSPSGSGWNEKDLYTFDFPYDGDAVPGGLVIDQSGDLYGGTIWGGQTNFGIVYELNLLPNGSWNANTIYTFSLASGGPYANLTMDAVGNLYGTAYGDGAHTLGSVFKLTPSPNGWLYTDLHDFSGSDGSHPISSVLLDANGTLYGTTSAGGTEGYGVVWELTP
jgi:uncharacterized repeat protein (TIGR03803 family)